MFTVVLVISHTWSCLMPHFDQPIVLCCGEKKSEIRYSIKYKLKQRMTLC